MRFITKILILKCIVIQYTQSDQTQEITEKGDVSSMKTRINPKEEK